MVKSQVADRMAIPSTANTFFLLVVLLFALIKWKLNSRFTTLDALVNESGRNTGDTTYTHTFLSIIKCKP